MFSLHIIKNISKAFSLLFNDKYNFITRQKFNIFSFTAKVKVYAVCGTSEKNPDDEAIFIYSLFIFFCEFNKN